MDGIFSNTLNDEVPNDSSQISYECHSLVFSDEMMKVLEASIDNEDNAVSSDAAQENENEYEENPDEEQDQGRHEDYNSREDATSVNRENNESETASTKSIVRNFQDSAVAKKIQEGKLREINTQDTGNSGRYRFIRRSRSFPDI